MHLSNQIELGSPAPAIVALCVALFGISAASAQTYPLPNVGSVNDCASTVRAFAGGHGNQSCAQTQGTVLPQRLKEPSFQAKCPVGQPLRGLLNNTCTDKPNLHPPHPMSSNYTTLCCGYTPPVGLPTTVPIGIGDIGQAKVIANRAAIEKNSAGLSTREEQILAIEGIADKLQFKRLEILNGKKKAIEAECKKHYPKLFGVGPDPFKRAWQAAVKQNRMRMQQHAKYSKR